MSTTVDSRVVEMRFDNKHFEKNVQTTMSTLDKLKQKLNLSGASKGLEQINTSANKVDMKGLSNALDTVTAKFSALDVMGVTALANITNSVVNAAKQMAHSLFIAPKSEGFKEYELMLTSIQTTMAGTGKTAEEVEEQLKSLDEYADKTVYSTADMLNNLPKFTNAGVELEVATKAMIGIANATALAGGDAQKASIAFYNLGQSIGTGYLTRMDYNSINNAGIATMEWKERMVEAAIAAGTLIEVEEGLYQAGNKTMSIQQLFIDGLQEQWATADVLIEVLGDYGDETTDIGKKAYAAAQNIKTYTMMMDSLKATAGTGWKDTWQIIFGDLDAATKFWTGLTNFISGIIEGIADVRNGILDSALGRSWTIAFDSVKKSVNGVKEAVKDVTDYFKLADDIIMGKWGNQPTRWKDLEEAGYDWAHAQNIVNEKLGSSVRHATNYKESVESVAKSEEKVTEATTEMIKELMKLSDAELKAKGYTDEQITAFRELKKVVDQTGIPLDTFLNKIDEIDGRWILVNALKNSFQGIVTLFKSMSEAWLDIFPVARAGDMLFNLIAGFHKFSIQLRVSEETAKNLKDTFKGLFAILDFILTIVGGPVKIGLKILGQLFKALDVTMAGVLKFTGEVGRGITAIHDWVDSLVDLTPVFEYLAPIIKTAASATRDWLVSLKDTKFVQTLIKYLNKARRVVVGWFNDLKGSVTVEKLTTYLEKASIATKKWMKELKNSEFVKTLAKYLNIAKEAVIEWFNAFKNSDAFIKLTEYLKNSKDAIWEWIKGIKDAENIPKYILSGLINGLKSGAGTIIETVIELGRSLLDAIRKVLGIHSPSTEFFEVGKNAMQGLFNGISEFTGMLYNLVMSVGTKLIEIIKGLDIGSIFTILMGGGMAFAFVKIARAVDLLTRPLEHVDDLVHEAKQTLEVFQGLLKSFKMRMYAESFKSIAVGIAILAGSLALLTQVDQGKLWSAVGALSVMTAVLAGLVYVAGTYGKGNGLELGKIGLTLLALSVSMGIMALALRSISKIDPETGLQTILGFGGMITALLLVMKSIGQNGDKMAGLGTTFMSIGAALLMMAIVARMIGGMDARKLEQGAGAIAVFSLIIVGLMAATKLIGDGWNMDVIGNVISKVGAAFLMMAIVARITGSMRPEHLEQGLATITVFGLLIAGLMYATKFVGDSWNIDVIGKAIFGIAGAMLMMALVARVVGSMNPNDLAQGVSAISTFALIIAGLMYATRLVGGKDLTRVGSTIMAVAVAVGILGVTAALLSLMDLGGLAKGVIAVGFLSLFVMGLITACKHAQQFMGTMIAITTAVGILALAVGLLSLIDPKRLAGATAAIGILLGMLALVIASTSMAQYALPAMLTVIGAIVVLSIVLALLSKLPVETTLKTASSLSILLLAMSAALAVASAFGPTAMAGVGAIALMALVVGGLALVLGLMSKFNVDSAIESAKALSILLLTMSAALVVLSGVGLLGPAAFIGIGALATLIVGIGGLIVAIGALINKFPMLETFLNTGMPILAKIGTAIGTFFGSIVSGFAVSAASGLPVIGTLLSQFMINATPFINGLKNIDPSMVIGVGILAASIVALSAANLIEGITSLLAGDSLAELGLELSKFMTNVMPFINGSKLINNSMMEGVKTLAEAILILTGANLVEGIGSWLTGKNSISDFGTELAGLGTCLNEFASNLGEFDKGKIATVDSACGAIKALAEAASTIPNEGGLWGSIVGENSLSSFGYKLPGLAKNINGFITNLGTFDNAKLTTVDCAGKAIKTLAEAAKKIPNDGGIWAAIVGENSLATFGNKLPGLATNINGFITNLGTFDSSKTDVVDCACKAIKTLAKAAGEIPNEGGLWASIVGENSLAAFGNKLPGLATNIKEFVNALGTFTPEQVDTVNSACKAIKALASLGKLDVKDTGKDLKSFGKNLVKFASKLKEFIADFSEIDTAGIDTAITKTKDIVAMATSIASTDIKGLDTFTKSLKTVATNGVKGFVKAFSGETPKADAQKATGAMLTAAIKGAEDKREDVISKFKSVAGSAVNALYNQDLTNKARQAGRDFVSGFAIGISNNTYLATNAGSQVGSAALLAAKAAIDSNSPSKEAMKLGNDFDNGFVIGIKALTSKVYDASYNMADHAKTGLSNAIARVSNLINDGIDAQPTIRPVLDLSDVESRAGYLNNLFNNDPSVGVMANVRAISSGMNARIQNGLNNDVVSAIDRLRGDLGNVGGTTNNYNVNGVTYDDGSNIADAVGAIVRAAKIEGRT